MKFLENENLYFIVIVLLLAKANIEDHLCKCVCVCGGREKKGGGEGVSFNEL